MERRRAARLRVTGSALLTEGRIRTGATLRDLSEQGCALQLRGSVGQGERFALHLLIPEEGLPLLIQEARICWRAEGRIGLEFLAMSDQTREQLREYVRARHGS